MKLKFCKNILGNSYGCEMCNVQFKTQRELIQHKLEAHNPSRLPCLPCSTFEADNVRNRNTDFLNISTFVRHNKEFHPDLYEDLIRRYPKLAQSNEKKRTKKRPSKKR